MSVCPSIYLSHWHLAYIFDKEPKYKTEGQNDKIGERGMILRVIKDHREEKGFALIFSSLDMMLVS